MARLTASARRALPDSAFAGPGRTFPVEDKNHQKAARMLGASKKAVAKAVARYKGSK